jgi:serine acetyltransferase
MRHDVWIGAGVQIRTGVTIGNVSDRRLAPGEAME